MTVQACAVCCSNIIGIHVIKYWAPREMFEMFMSHHMVYYRRLTQSCVKQKKLTSTWVSVTVFYPEIKKDTDFRLSMCLTNVPSKSVIRGLVDIIEHQVSKHSIYMESLSCCSKMQMRNPGFTLQCCWQAEQSHSCTVPLYNAGSSEWSLSFALMPT